MHSLQFALLVLAISFALVATEPLFLGGLGLLGLAKLAVLKGAIIGSAARGRRRGYRYVYNRS